MATVSKASRSKIKKSPAVAEEHKDVIDQEQDLDIAPGKSKKPIEIDEPEAVVGLDEKIEEDPLLGATEEDDSADEISLDGEEVNPFGDRWEE